MSMDDDEEGWEHHRRDKQRRATRNSQKNIGWSWVWKHVLWGAAVFIMTLLAVTGWAGWLSSREESRKLAEEIRQKDEVLDRAAAEMHRSNEQRRRMVDLLEQATKRLEQLRKE